MPAGHLSFGREGEDLAAGLLAAKGYQVLERNWRTRRGEVDIIAKDGDTLVFVEVKSRGPGSLGTGAQAVDRAKRRRIMKAAAAYLSGADMWHAPCRFDVVSVEMVAGQLQASHIEDAFDAPAAQGQGGGDWQPW